MLLTARHRISIPAAFIGANLSHSDKQSGTFIGLNAHWHLATTTLMINKQKHVRRPSSCLHQPYFLILFYFFSSMLRHPLHPCLMIPCGCATLVVFASTSATNSLSLFFILITINCGNSRTSSRTSRAFQRPCHIERMWLW